MTFEESAQLINDQAFRGRVKVAALLYAQYLSQQPNLGNAKQTWIRQTMQAPDQAAQLLSPNVVINPNVQQAGAAVTDANLQAAVQYVADAMM